MKSVILLLGLKDVLNIFWKRGEIAHYEQFLLSSTILCYLLLDFHVKTGTRVSLPVSGYKWLFKITKVEITTVDCNSKIMTVDCNSKIIFLISQ